MEVKFTDEEIIRAIKCNFDVLEGVSCGECSCRNTELCDKTDVLMENFSNLINRLKKEEEQVWADGCRFGWNKAIKEFAERLKKAYKLHFSSAWKVIYNTIDNLVSELIKK